MSDFWIDNQKQLPVMPVYQTDDGVLHRTLHEAAKHLGVVTYDPTHALIRRPGDSPAEVEKKSALYAERSRLLQAGTFSQATLFREIIAVPKMAPRAITDLYPAGPGINEEMGVEDMVDVCLSALFAHIETEWKPDAFHPILHSSGYDTRLLMAILKRLADKNGSDWLGECRMCAFQPEIERARAVFQYMGWPEEFWLPVGEGAPAEDYYARCLDFNVVGAHLCDAERFWGGPLKTKLLLDGLGLLQGETSTPSDPSTASCQSMTALFSDESLKWNRLKWGNVGWLLACHFMDQPGFFPGAPHITSILPFASVGWLSILSENYCPLPIDQFKLAMIRRLDPGLGDIEALPNFRFEVKEIRERNGGHLDQQAISAGTVERMKAAYEASRFASLVGPSTIDLPETFLYYDDSNTNYMKAAIIESLIDTGVEVVR